MGRSERQGSRVTRGPGVLEGFLARQRAKQADRLIPGPYRRGAILDIGCGAFPLFLARTDFAEKHGLDKLGRGVQLGSGSASELKLLSHDIETDIALPYEADSFDIVSMLAVIEHIDPDRVTPLLSEVRRMLKPRGLLVLTTPAKWTDRLLRLLASLRLVSPVEIREHKELYDHAKLSKLLHEVGFDQVRLGYFEAGMNIWATALK